MLRRPLFAALLIFVAPATFAQAVLHPGVMEVTTRFTNVHPEIRTFLDAPRGSWHSALEAHSVGLATTLEADSSVNAPARQVTDQQVTVESSATGIPYTVYGYQALIPKTGYRFAGVVSPPVQVLPAPPVEVELAECASLIRICLRDGLGAPVVAEGLRAWTPRDPHGPPNLGNPQADASELNASELQFAVRGTGIAIPITIEARFGTDPYSDLVVQRWTFDVTPECDQIVEIGCSGGGGFCNRDPAARGRIVGIFDVFGEEVVAPPSSSLTQAKASFGPWYNERMDRLTSPPTGPFELENLVVDGCCSEYDVGVSWATRRGRSHCSAATPLVPTEVFPGATTDLGDLFVMTPGFVFGDVVLAGPPADPALPAVHDTLLHWDSPTVDTDADGLPDGWGGYSCQPTTVFGRLRNIGTTATGVPGAVNPLSGTLDGSYELVLAHPDDVGSWVLGDLGFRHVATGTPEVPLSYVSSCLRVTQDEATLTVRAGDRVRRDVLACFGLVRVAFSTTSGTLHSPSLTILDDVPPARDFKGRAVRRDVGGQAGGTPQWSAPAPAGLVQWPLPEGTYLLAPEATVANPDGSSSRTEFLPVLVTVGCRQVIDAHPDLGISMTGLPPCAEDGVVRVEARVTSSHSIARAWAVADGGAEVTICTDCGVNPPLSADVTLGPGEHEVSVHVLDDAGREAIATSVARFTHEPSSRPGAQPLRLSRSAAGLTLSWEDVGGQPANVYRGTLASLHRGTYDHGGMGSCGITTAATEIPMPAGSAYFLVTGSCDWGDTTAGRDSRGVPVPPARDACR